MDKEADMYVFRFERLTGLHEPTLRNEPAPVPQRGEVLVKVRAVSLSRRDLMIAKGDYLGAVVDGRIPLQ